MKQRRLTISNVFAVALMLACAAFAAGQNAAAPAEPASPPAAAPTPTPAPAPTSSPAPTKMIAVPIPIAPGDLLEMTVFDSPELTQQVRVGEDGLVQLNLIGNTEVGGLTSRQAADLIASELRDRHFVLHPQVNVMIKEFASKGVSVTGEVKNPGVYPVLGPRTVLDVLSLAGGATSYADSKISIKHRSGTQETITYKLNNTDARSSVANDVQVYPGDLVVVPRAGVVYVLGDVNRPGGFVMQDSGKITVLQALAQAGGTSSRAATNKALLLHKKDSGYITDKLELDKISRGKVPDMELQPNDIIFVPNSRMKNIMLGTRNMGQMAGSAALYGVIP